MSFKHFIIPGLIVVALITGCKNDPLVDNEGEPPLEELIPAALDEEFRLEIGETALVESENIEITLQDVTDDSRCPSDVVCIWAGRVKVLVKIMKDEVDLGDFTLTGNGGDAEATATFDGYSVKLLKVEPYPISTRPIEPDEYIITLIISRA